MKPAGIARFFAELGWLWVVLVSSIGSVALMVIAMLIAASVKEASLWLSSYICLAIAGLTLWYREHAKGESLRHQVDSLSSPVDPRILALGEFANQAKVFLEWLTEPTDSELFIRLQRGLPQWDTTLKDFLDSKLPQHLAAYIDPFPFPDLNDPKNRTAIHLFLQRKLKVLESVIQGRSGNT